MLHIRGVHTIRRTSPHIAVQVCEQAAKDLASFRATATKIEAMEASMRKNEWEGPETEKVQKRMVLEDLTKLDNGMRASPVMRIGTAGRLHWSPAQCFPPT